MDIYVVLGLYYDSAKVIAAFTDPYEAADYVATYNRRPVRDRLGLIAEIHKVPLTTKD